LYLNGIPVGKKINCYFESGVKPFDVELGTFVLSEGENIFSIKILGADKRARPGNMVGLDFLVFEKLE